MAKNKKKPSPHEINKIAAAHQRNEFFDGLVKLAKHLGNEKIISKIPVSEKETLYETRIRSIKVIYDSSENLDLTKNTSIVKILQAQLKLFKVPITPNFYLASISEYYTYPMTMLLYLGGLDDNAYPAAKELKELFKPISHEHYSDFKVLTAINTVIFTTYLVFNNYNDKIYDIKLGVFNDELNRKRPSACLEIKAIVPEKINVKIDNIVRPVIRLCFGKFNSETVKCILKPSDFGEKNPFSDLELDVYVQSHALLRLKERLDNIFESLLHYALYDSVKRKRTCKDIHGNYLIEYYLFFFKLGYLRVDLVEGIAVIRTFLFLTNNSTPEGEKLNKLTGTEILDKEYLLIDKLSTFSSDKIINNEQIKNIFIKAGCESLFRYKNEMKGLVDEKDMSPDSMLKHLNLMNIPVPETVSEESEKQ